MIEETIITDNYTCLWCGENKFYVKDEIYDGIYLDLYCINKDCKCRQTVKTDNIKYEVI